MVIHGGVAVFVQQLLHPAKRDGGKVPRVLQLEETLQVRRRLAASYIHPLAVNSIQPKTKHIPIKTARNVELARANHRSEFQSGKIV